MESNVVQLNARPRPYSCIASSIISAPAVAHRVLLLSARPCCSSQGLQSSPGPLHVCAACARAPDAPQTLCSLLGHVAPWAVEHVARAPSVQHAQGYLNSAKRAMAAFIQPIRASSSYLKGMSPIGHSPHVHNQTHATCVAPTAEPTDKKPTLRMLAVTTA